MRGRAIGHVSAHLWGGLRGAAEVWTKLQGVVEETGDAIRPTLFLMFRQSESSALPPVATGSRQDNQPSEDDVRRAMARYDVLKRLVPVVWIVAAWVPLQAIYPIADVLAGKHTNVALTFSVSIAISLALGSGYVALIRRARAQASELLRLRERCARLEGELEVHKG
jgi:hypothetical protein